MPARPYRLTVERGASLEVTFPAVALDLTGHELELRISDRQEGGVWAEPAVTLAEDGRTITAKLAAEKTRNLVFDEGFYDLIATAADGTVRRLFEGLVQVNFGAVA